MEFLKTVFIMIVVIGVFVFLIGGTSHALNNLEGYEQSFYLENFNQIEDELKESIEGEIEEIDFKREGFLFFRDHPSYEVHTEQKSYKVDVPAQNLLYSPFFYKNEYKKEDIKILRVTEMNRTIITSY